MQNKEYWERRFIESVLESERSVMEYEKRLQDAYNLAIVEIRKEIDAFFSKYAIKNKLNYTEARRRLSDTEIRDFQTLLKEWYRAAGEAGLNAQYKQYLQELSKKVYVSRMEQLEASARFQIEKLKNNQYLWMNELMITNFISGYYNNYYNISKGVNTGVKFGTIDTGVVETAVRVKYDGQNYSDRIWNDKDKLIRTIEQAIPRSMAQGLNANQLGDFLAKELQVSNTRGRTLARTEVNYIQNQSTLGTYKAAGLAEYEFLSTLDSRTSEICRGMDGQVFKTSQAKVGINYPPLHPNCRSTTIPHFEDNYDEEDDYRAARDEDGKTIKVPRRMSQEEWIRTYVPQNQQEIVLKFNKSYQVSE